MTKRCPRNKYGCRCQMGDLPDVGFEIGDFFTWPVSRFSRHLSLWRIVEIHVPTSVGTKPTLWSRCIIGVGQFKQYENNAIGPGFFPEHVQPVEDPVEVYLELGGENALELLALAAP